MWSLSFLEGQGAGISHWKIILTSKLLFVLFCFSFFYFHFKEF